MKWLLLVIVLAALASCAPKPYVPVYFIHPKDNVKTERAKESGFNSFHIIPSDHPTTRHLIAQYDTIHYASKKKERKTAVTIGLSMTLLWLLILTLMYE